MVVVKVGIILIFGFRDDHTGVLIIFPPFPPHRFLSRRTAHYPICFFSAVFIGCWLNGQPYYRKREPDRVLAADDGDSRIALAILR